MCACLSIVHNNISLWCICIHTVFVRKLCVYFYTNLILCMMLNITYSTRMYPEFIEILGFFFPLCVISLYCSAAVHVEAGMQATNLILNIIRTREFLILPLACFVIGHMIYFFSALRRLAVCIQRYQGENRINLMRLCSWHLATANICMILLFIFIFNSSLRLSLFLSFTVYLMFRVVSASAKEQPHRQYGCIYFHMFMR